jgi:hypothetical protein
MGERVFSHGRARALAAAVFVVFACTTSMAFAASPGSFPARAGTKGPSASGTVGIATDDVAGWIPGTELRLDGRDAYFNGTLQVDLASTRAEDDVHRVYLASGEVVTLTIHGDSGTDFGVALFGPEALDIFEDDPLAFVLPAAWGGPGTYPLTIASFTVPKTGYYFIDVFTFIDDDDGHSGGSGAYSLAFHVLRSTTWIEFESVPTLSFGGQACIEGTIHGREAGLVAGDCTVFSSEDGVYYDPVLTMQSPDGTLGFWMPPNYRTMRYMVQFAGTEFCNPTVAGPVVAKMSALLTSVSGSRYGTRSYTLSGNLGSWHTGGSGAVRVYLWRSVNGHWKAYGYRTAKAAAYGFVTKYSVKYKFPYKGKWRMQAYHSDASHATTRSGYTYLTVR